MTTTFAGSVGGAGLIGWVRRCLVRGALALVISLGMLGHTVRAQDLTASVSQLTAAFLLHFVKFTEWPADVLTTDAPVVVCIAEPSVAEIAIRAISVLPSGARTVTIARVALELPIPRECAILYAPDLDARRTATLIASLGGRSVLSVGNTEAFTRHGGVIHLLVESGHMKFAVNPAAADRARLRLSALLLKLAQIVKEDP